MRMIIFLVMLCPAWALAYTVASIDKGVLYLQEQKAKPWYTTVDCQLKPGDSVSILKDHHGNRYFYNKKNDVNCYIFTY